MGPRTMRAASGRTGLRLALILLITLAMAAPRAMGRRADTSNAAHWYEMAIDRFDVMRSTAPAAEVQAGLRGVEAQLARPGAAPSTELRAFLARLGPVLSVLEKAAQRPRHEFDLDYDDGPRMVLRHLSYFRVLTRCLAADAAVRMHDGDDAGAARRLATVYGIAEHAAHDRILESTLTALSAFELADALTRSAIDQGRAGPEGSEVLGRALERYAGADPFRLVEAARTVQTSVMPWLRERFSGPGGIDRLREEFIGMWADPVTRASFDTMDQTQLDANVSAAEQAIARVVEAFEGPDPDLTRVQLVRLDGEIRGGHHGVFARTILPQFTPVFDRVRRDAAAAAERREVLTGLASGRLDVGATANAATWYRRAIERLGALSAEERERVATFAADPARRMDEDLAAALGRAQPLVDLLRQATGVTRCELAHGDDEGGRGPIPPELGPLRECVRLLQVDAVRSIQAQDFDGAVDRLGTCLRVAAHLSRDGRLVSSLVADAAFDTTFALLGPGLRSEVFTLEQRMRLLGAAREVGYRDPFGYDAAAEAERSRLAEAFRERVAGAEQESTHGGGDLSYRIESALAACDADQVLFLALVTSVLRPARAGGDAAAALTAAAAPLDDILPRKRVEAALGQVEAVRDAVEAARFESLTERTIPPIARLAERRAAAQAAVRKALVAIRGEAEGEHVAGK